MLIAGYLSYIVIAVPVFMLLGATQSILVVGLVYFVYMVLNGVVQVPSFPLFTELFGRRVRYTGVALGFNTANCAVVTGALSMWNPPPDARARGAPPGRDDRRGNARRVDARRRHPAQHGGDHALRLPR